MTSAPKRRARRALLAAFLAFVVALAAANLATSGAEPEAFNFRRYLLRVTSQPDRTHHETLDGSTLTKPVHVFLALIRTKEVRSVEFFLDDTGMRRAPFRIEREHPYDAGGGGWDGNAIAWDVTKLSPGAHTLTYRTTWKSGNVGSGSARFTVARGSTSTTRPTATTVRPTTTTVRPTTTTTRPTTTTTRPHDDYDSTSGRADVEHLPEPGLHRSPRGLGADEGARR